MRVKVNVTRHVFVYAVGAITHPLSHREFWMHNGETVRQEGRTRVNLLPNKGIDFLERDGNKSLQWGLWS